MEIKEFWKPIKGYRNFYEVSNLGRVRQLGGGLSKKDKILKQKNFVSLSNGFTDRKFKIVDLVEEAFPGTFLSNIIRMNKEAENAKGSSSHVTIIERTDELLERQPAIGSINHEPKQVKEKKEYFKEHRKETKGKWFNP